MLLIAVATIVLAVVLVGTGRSSGPDGSVGDSGLAGNNGVVDDSGGPHPDVATAEASGSTGDRGADDVGDATADGIGDGGGDRDLDGSEARGTAFVDAVCSGRVEVEDLGPLGSDEIDEASGLAASHANPGVWWTHNDSGGRPELYALDERGTLLAVVRIKGVVAHDWEDIASVVDDDGAEMIFIGDIGDAILGKAARDHVTVHVIRAPVLSTTTAEPDGTPTVIDVDATTTDLVYPDGPRDAEALMADLYDDAMYLIDKDWSMKGNSTLYRVPLEDLTGGGPRTVTLERVTDLDLPELTLITAADASADGSAVALRGYGFEALYHRSPGQSIADALSGDHCRGPQLDEIQGEAIGFSTDSSSYVTVAEGRGAVLHRVAATTRD